MYANANRANFALGCLVVRHVTCLSLRADFQRCRALDCRGAGGDDGLGTETPVPLPLLLPLPPAPAPAAPVAPAPPPLPPPLPLPLLLPRTPLDASDPLDRTRAWRAGMVASRSRSAIAWWPLACAMCIAARPLVSRADSDAPERTNTSTTSRWFWYAAQCKAVNPPLSAALSGSAPPTSSNSCATAPEPLIAAR